MSNRYATQAASVLIDAIEDRARFAHDARMKRRPGARLHHPARAAEALMGAPEWRTSVGLAARQRVHKNFSLDASVTAMAHLLSELAGPHRRASRSARVHSDPSAELPTIAQRLA